jgi:hypothetical protein
MFMPGDFIETLKKREMVDIIRKKKTWTTKRILTIAGIAALVLQITAVIISFLASRG